MPGIKVRILQHILVGRKWKAGQSMLNSSRFAVRTVACACLLDKVLQVYIAMLLNCECKIERGAYLINEMVSLLIEAKKPSSRFFSASGKIRVCHKPLW